MSEEWRDGFLFLGNDLALDFLNTKPEIEGSTVEMLPEGAAVARWIRAAGLAASGAVKRLESEADVKALREFRERWREQVFRIETGRSPSHAFLTEVNRLLAAHPYLDKLDMQDGAIELRKYFAPACARDLFAPLAHSVALLLSENEPDRIRKCAQCVLHFRDTSKKGNRQWCSMNLCGNRHKVAAYAARKRAAIGDPR